MTEVFETNIDIDDHQLIERIKTEGKLPTTAAPSPGKFAKAYQAAFEEDDADAVICFVVSSKVSATYDAALIAANELMPDKDITVVDTLSLTLGQGFMAITAAEAVANGASSKKPSPLPRISVPATISSARSPPWNISPWVGVSAS